MSVNEFVKTNVLPEHQDIVAMIRGLMRETAPDAKEIISYGFRPGKASQRSNFSLVF